MRLIATAVILLLLLGAALSGGESKSARRISTLARYALLTALAFVFLLPFVGLLASAFKDPGVANLYAFFPPLEEWSRETVNLTNFELALRPTPTRAGPITFWNYLFNSLLLACGTTVIQIFFSALAGFALAKYRFAGRELTQAFMLATLFIPGVLLLAPSYELFVKLGLIDTYAALLLPGAVSVFGVFLYRQAMLGVPNELLDAARIDGCRELRIFWDVVLPVVRPMTGAFALMSFLGNWNNYLGVSVMIHDQSKVTLPVAMKLFLANEAVNLNIDATGIGMAGTLISLIPPAIAFFALQHEFVRGLTSGAVKG